MPFQSRTRPREGLMELFPCGHSLYQCKCQKLGVGVVKMLDHAAKQEVMSQSPSQLENCC